MKLTEKAVEQFQREGYLKIGHRILDDDHLATLRKHYDLVFAQKHGTFGEGMRNIAAIGESADDPEADHSEVMLQIQQMWQRDEAFRELLYHSPLLDIAESLIGPNIQVFFDQALYKPAKHGGAVHWHQDNGYWGCVPPNLVSIWMALDDADEENGCMNVIPGSHREGGAEHERAMTEKGKLPALLKAKVDTERAVAVPVKAGYAMVHHCLMLHQTNPNTSTRERRAMIIHYMPTGTRTREGALLVEQPVVRGEFRVKDESGEEVGA